MNKIHNVCRDGKQRVATNAFSPSWLIQNTVSKVDNNLEMNYRNRMNENQGKYTTNQLYIIPRCDKDLVEIKKNCQKRKKLGHSDQRPWGYVDGTDIKDDFLAFI